MHLILLQKEPGDFVISTGTSTSLERFIDLTFQNFNLDFRDYIVIKKELIRPTDIGFSLGDSSKAAELLKWVPQVQVKEIIERMIKDKLSIDRL
jgi:GDPmannose 4,6-dehydratase